MSLWERLRSEEGLLDPVLVRLIDDPTTGGVVAVGGLAIAVGVGAVHALGPGHGKALVGAYLAGSRGRARDAVALGAIVAAMHTASVLVLAFVLRATQRAVASAWLDGVLVLLAALAVASVGAWMLVHRVRAGRTPAPSHPAGAGHHHARRSSDGHGHHHHHVPPDGVAPLSRAGIVALATTGGLLPSPTAFLVLMSALALGRMGYGLALVLAFSVGLAVTLAGVGLAVLLGRGALERRAAHRRTPARLLRVLPTASALAVLTGGLLLAAHAVVRL